MKATQLILISTYLISLGKCIMQPYIVNGKPGDNIANFSYTALLSFQCVIDDSTVDFYICGSSIVNQLLVLSAGHCVYQCTSESKIYVYVGHENPYSGILTDVHSFTLHDDYNPQTISNDISIIRVKTPLELNAKIGRVALMPDPPYNEEAILTGWELFDEASQVFPDIIQYTTQNVMTNEKCQKVFETNVTEGTICVNNPESYPSNGDSGGPLVVKGYIQIGIVSYIIMRDSGVNENVVFYTDIGHFYKWIDEKANELACHQ